MFAEPVRFVFTSRGHYALIITAFIFYLLVAVLAAYVIAHNDIRDDVASQNEIWVSTQVEREMYHLIDQVDTVRHHMDGSADTVEIENKIREIKTRFDILWSRVDILNAGIEARALMILENERSQQVISQLKQTLKTSDAQIRAVTPDNIAPLEHVRKSLKAQLPEVHSLIVSAQLLNRKRIHQFLSSIDKNFTLVLGLLFMSLLTGVVFVLLAYKRERDIRQSGERLRLATETANIAVWEYIPARGRLIATDTLRHQFGFTSPDDCTIEKIIACADRKFRANLRAVLTGSSEHNAREIDNLDFKITLPDGAERWLAVAGQRFTHGQKDGGNVRGTVIDITDRKRSESGLQHAKTQAEEASRTKSEFLASMSHELRTPLNAVIGFTEMLKYDTRNPLTEKQQDSIESVLTAANHLLTLVNDLLDLARIEADKVEFDIRPVDLTGLLSECQGLISPLAENYNVVLEELPADPMPAILADERRLKQSLINLMSNAVKYNKEGGSVRVRCAPAQDDFIRIKVVDTGHGIPEDAQPWIFQMFNQVKHSAALARDGTGVGLHVTKALVERMGGRVGFSSKAGDGSTFWIELPVANSTPASAANDGAPPAAPARGQS
ncbi:MAG: PAS domain S-box protein [Rhodospirillales bacterium]|nr:PAS domain S-box protein [Rhodospirillales bacterium]MBO6787294.1 PAS domain S-box protein [Rhodospirillales bacterium]